MSGGATHLRPQKDRRGTIPLRLFLFLTAATAADLTLLHAGKSDDQIVLPDALPYSALK